MNPVDLVRECMATMVRGMDIGEVSLEHMENGVEIVILDNDSQGFAVQLNNDGTFTTYPVGG